MTFLLVCRCFGDCSVVIIMFPGVNWQRITSTRRENYNTEHAVDSSMVFLNEDQEPFKSAIFDQY